MARKKIQAKKSVGPGKSFPHGQGFLQAIEPIVRLWAWILLVWSLYRYFIVLPEWTDEFFFKPLVFVAPVLYYVFKREHRDLASLGLTGKRLFNSVYIGLGFGVMFALEGVLANSIKYGSLTIRPIASLVENGLVPLLIISLATAFSEEVLNRGFLFRRILERTKNLPFASLLSTVMFILLHVPILVTSTHLTGGLLGLFLVTNLVIGVVNSLLLYNTGSLVAPILIHVFWNMTVALYL
jgi:membrane protease YdiL (CAAX protease family)